MTQISDDLIRPVLEHLEGDKSSLCAVSLCSDTLRHEAQRILFRDITTPEISLRSCKVLHKVIASPDRLALHVRRFRFSVISMPPEEVMLLLHDALKAMCNLKDLDSLYCWNHTPQTNRHRGLGLVLNGCTFNLERFHWGGFCDDVDTVLQNFISRQDKLQHLMIRFTDGSSDRTSCIRQISSTACLQLFSLEGTWDVIQSVLPGRQITTLGVIRDIAYPARIDDLGALEAALKKITALSYRFHTSHKDAPYHLPNFFTSVTILELEFESMIQHALFEILHQLTALHTLVLSELIWIPYGKSDPVPAINKIFSDSSMNLQRIDYQIKAEVYARYTRTLGAAVYQRVSKSEVRRSWLSG